MQRYLSLSITAHIDVETYLNKGWSDGITKRITGIMTFSYDRQRSDRLWRVFVSGAGVDPEIVFALMTAVPVVLKGFGWLEDLSKRLRIDEGSEEDPRLSLGPCWAWWQGTWRDLDRRQKLTTTIILPFFDEFNNSWKLFPNVCRTWSAWVIIYSVGSLFNSEACQCQKTLC